MVQAILEERKTQTRRVIKNIHSIYSLSDDRIYSIFTKNIKEDTNEKSKIEEWNPSEIYSSFTERGLHGGLGWTNLLADEIQRLWSQGIRGLVSIKRSHQQQGISKDISLSQKQESNKKCSQVDLSCIPRNATTPNGSGETQRRQAEQQSPRQSLVGNAGRKLVGQEGTRERQRRRKTSDGKTDKRRAPMLEMGNRTWTVQPASCSPCSKNVSAWHISYSQYQKGLILWVRETLRRNSEGIWVYKADDSWVNNSAEINNRNYCPSIHMPRWVSRITLEVIDIRVERVQEISGRDAFKEGVFNWGYGDGSVHKEYFQKLWDSINAKRGFGWDEDPFVWVIEFKRITK
jgi:hypothetical protein